MAIPTDLRGDFNASGAWRFTGDVVLPDDSVTEDMLAASFELPHSQVQHRQEIQYNQANGTDVVTETRLVHVAYAAETVLAGYAVVDVEPESGTSDKTVTVDVKKSTGGAAFATILSAELTINAASTAKTPLSLSLSGTPTLVAGDVLEVVVTAAGSSGTQVQGLCVVLTVAQDGA